MNIRLSKRLSGRCIFFVTVMTASGLHAQAFKASSAEADFEVLHWWSSGSEAKSVNDLKKMMKSAGYNWKDFLIAGGGGDDAMSNLKDRVNAGNPPAAAQFKTPYLQEFAANNKLLPLDEVANSHAWQKNIPPAVAETISWNEHVYAAPVGIHRVNWMWINPTLFAKAGAKPPKTWDEFFVAADKIRQAGYIPLAHGAQPWQNFTLFETIALGIGGADFYRDLLKLSPNALQSDSMKQSLKTLRHLKNYTDSDKNRTWNDATAMLIQRRAAVQFMGDWAKGEFINSYQKPGKDFLCLPAPQTHNAFIYTVDSFAMFSQTSSQIRQGQLTLAKLIMSPEFQRTFNLNKGSVPAVDYVDMKDFDNCGKQSKADLATAAKLNTLVPSTSKLIVNHRDVQDVIQTVITSYWENPLMTEDQVISKLEKLSQQKPRTAY